MIQLPVPRYDGKLSLEAVLRARRSVRTYRDEALSLADIAQLLWAAQGITRKNGMRTAPSAGALYPLEVYLEVGQVEQLAEGIYQYRPDGHQLAEVCSTAKRREVTAAAYGQGCIERGAVNIVLAAVYERTARKYGERAVRYVHMEAGHAAQNISLQAVALGLGSVVVGAFDDGMVQKALLLDNDAYPLCILPVGRVG